MNSQAKKFITYKNEENSIEEKTLKTLQSQNLSIGNHLSTKEGGRWHT